MSLTEVQSGRWNFLVFRLTTYAVVGGVTGIGTAMIRDAAKTAADRARESVFTGITS